MSPSEETCRRARWARVDVVIAVLMGAFVVGVTGAIAHWHPSGGRLDLPGYLWLAAGAAPLAWRGRAPLLVFLACSALVFSYYSSGYPGGPSVITVLFALVSLSFLRGPVVAGGAALLLCVVVFAGHLLTGYGLGPLDPRLFGFVAVLLGMVAVGTAGRTHRAAVTARRERGRESALRQAEERRLAIAREVHDVVAHSLAMINVQAGVGAHVADRRPAEAKAALLAIKEASRTALADLRATLDVLRSGEDLAPTPGLARLPELIGTAAAAGLSVTAEGAAGELPAPVDVAAYRIVQESLTNVVRHARDAGTVRISFDRDPAELRISVCDDGRGPYLARPGNGLRGMAERARALGGEAGAGPAPDGGFQVLVRLPVGGGGESA